MASCAAIGNRRSSSEGIADPRRPIANRPQLNKLPHKTTPGDKIRRYVLVKQYRPAGFTQRVANGVTLSQSRLSVTLARFALTANEIQHNSRKKHGAANGSRMSQAGSGVLTATIASTTNENPILATRNRYPIRCIFISITIAVPAADDSNRPLITGRQGLRFETMRLMVNPCGEISPSKSKPLVENNLFTQSCGGKGGGTACPQVEQKKIPPPAAYIPSVPSQSLASFPQSTT